jgi:hypothetical protein
MAKISNVSQLPNTFTLFPELALELKRIHPGKVPATLPDHLWFEQIL